MTIFINGRFLTIANTGVRRVAMQLVDQLDTLMVEQPGVEEWRLIYPSAAAQPPLLKNIRCEAVSGPPGQLWEQVALPGAARDGLLFNPANTAPILAKRSVVMVHDAQVYDAPQSYSLAFRLWYKFMLPRVCRNAAGVLTVSRHSAERLCANGVIRKADDAEVVFNGVDHILSVEADRSILAAKDLGKRPFLLGFSSDQPHKNTRLLLEIAKSPRLADFDIALIGSRLPAGLTPSPTVKMLGPVSDSRLRALYEACFAFLLPSLTEGFGLPAGEAMLCNAPVIASSQGALSEVWREGARLASPDKPEAWVDAVLELRDTAARDALQKRGLEHARQFTWRAAAMRLRQLIEKTAAKHRVVKGAAAATT